MCSSLYDAGNGRFSLTEGLATCVNMGLKIENKEILGGTQGKIFALGSLLFGEKFETTAVPEIREQALSIATTIIEDFYNSQLNKF